MIKGIVSDEKGVTLPSANIQLVDAENKPILSNGFFIGTTTDVNGNYVFNGANVGDYLRFTYMGYEPLFVKTTNQTQNAILKESNVNLSEITITASKISTTKKVFGFLAVLAVIGWVKSR